MKIPIAQVMTLVAQLMTVVAQPFRAAVFVSALFLAACGGGSPPTTPPPPPANNNPPANTAPAIDGITVQGRRARQPARFADLRETVDVSATVRDPETAIEELVYQWTATAGTFAGTGRSVTWTAPDSATTPVTVTITLKVIENYGHPGQAKVFSQDTTSTSTVSLHDSAKEVAEMSVRFLDRFSQPQTIKDWRVVMADFKASACPDPGEFDSEREDVERHYNNFVMNQYMVGVATASINFGGSCIVPTRNPLRGDACAAAPVFWDSTHRADGRSTNSGVDYLAAAYSASDGRWWLCSSSYIGSGTLGHSFYSR